MNRFCQAPWKQILIGRKLKPCCVYEGGVDFPPDVDNIFDFYEEHLARDLKNANVMNSSGCAQCIKKEKVGLKSRRNYYEKNVTADFDDITYIDLRFSNICNMKCRFCESAASSMWKDDEYFLIDNDFKRHQLPVAPYVTPDNIINQLINHCNNSSAATLFLDIKGGEPFISNEFLNFLKLLSPVAKQKIEITVTTNCVSVSKKYLDELVQFKKVIIGVSVETADDALYRYIRGGNKFGISELENKIKLIQSYNFEIRPSSVVSIYNVFVLPELLEWMLQVSILPNWFAFSNFVYTPSYLDPGILPNAIKDDLCKRFAGQKELVPVVTYLKNNSYDAEQMALFEKFNNLLDKNRNETFGKRFF